MNLIDRIEKQKLWLTDGGLETSLIYESLLDLPHFAAFPLIDKQRFNPILKDYYAQYLAIAVRLSPV